MFVFHSLLAFRASFPRCHTGFVTSYVNVFGREKRHDLGQHIFQKGERFFVSDTEVRVLVRLTRARELRISCQHFFRVGRHFNLRNNRDEMLTSIFYDFANIILCIVTSGSSRLVETEVLTSAVPPRLPIGVSTPGCKFFKQRIFLDFNSPACRICKVQMQAVDLIECQCVYLFLHKFFRKEMTGYIQH